MPFAQERGSVSRWFLLGLALVAVLSAMLFVARRVGTVRAPESHTGAVQSVLFSPDGTLLASNGVDGSIRLWRVSDGQMVRIFNRRASYASCIALSPDGKLLASGTLEGTLNLWEVRSGKLLGSLNEHVFVKSVSFSPDGKLWRREACSAKSR
jgi:WD40 repeat protein